MTIFESISNFLKNKSKTTTEIVTPEGFCPNCWGRQEYEGQFFEAMENQEVDINNINDKKGWVQDYADKHLSLIHLKKEGENHICAKCKTIYSPAE